MTPCQRAGAGRITPMTNDSFTADQRDLSRSVFGLRLLTLDEQPLHPIIAETYFEDFYAVREYEPRAVVRPRPDGTLWTVTILRPQTHSPLTIRDFRGTVERHGDDFIPVGPQDVAHTAQPALIYALVTLLRR
jgi:hypothetical protein